MFLDFSGVSPLALLFWFPLCILLVCLGAPFTLFIKFSTYKKKKVFLGLLQELRLFPRFSIATYV
jgi:hypothetical protein